MSEIKVQRPVVLSVSRATDIPAFYSEWFFNRLKTGYCLWKNPYNGEFTRIEFDKVKFIVFWSKNPAQLIPYIPKLKEKGIGFYVQFTLNDYEEEKFEPGLPSLSERIETFKELSRLIGKDRVIWRFDPMILTDKITVDSLWRKVNSLSLKLYGYTDKLVFSFVDIKNYTKIGRNMFAAGINYREWTEDEMRMFAKGLYGMNKYFNFTLATCAERVDLSEFGIQHNHCIDSDLIVKLCQDSELLDYLGYEVHNIETDLFGDGDNVPENGIRISDTQYAIQTKANKDKGQRALCGCCTAKDIGSYNTCPHRCVYCYANVNPYSAESSYRSVVQNIINSESLS